jgi:uncharacterized membrane protein
MNHMTAQSWARQQTEIEARRERTTDKIAAAILMLIVMACAAVVLAIDEPRPAECVTDTECAALCPVNDVECDGGPR